MTSSNEIALFLSNYRRDVAGIINDLRCVIKRTLPNIIEQLDLPAKMIAYCYGQRYADMICVIFPSQKGVKLSFDRGVDLPDPENMLRGNAKTTRYLEFKPSSKIDESVVKYFLHQALEMYKSRS